MTNGCWTWQQTPVGSGRVVNRNVEHAFSYWKFEIRGDFQLHPATCTICSGIPFFQDFKNTWCDNERRGSRSKSSSIIAPNPRSGERWQRLILIPSAAGIMMDHSRFTCWTFNNADVRFEGGFFRGWVLSFQDLQEHSWDIFSAQDWRTYGYQQWYMENIQLGLEQA